MKILVTGITGFIGFALITYLKKKGYEVTGLVRESSQTDKLNDIPLAVGDITDGTGLNEAFYEKDVVIHCAGFVSDWGPRQKFIETNYTGSKNVFEACAAKKVPRVIYISTVDIFGHKKSVTIDEQSPFGKRPDWYGKSKIMAEKLARKYIATGKLNLSMIYPSWVYGEGDAHFASEIIEAIKKGGMLFFRNGGKTILEICYIKNLVSAVENIMLSDKSAGEGFIITDDPKITINTYVNTLAAKMDHKPVRFTLPYPVSYVTALLMEALFRLIRNKKRPLLTRQAVSLMGNNILYKNDKLKSLEYKQVYEYDEALDNTLRWYTEKHNQQS